MRNETRKPRVINRNGKSTLILDDTPERKYHKVSIELEKKSWKNYNTRSLMKKCNYKGNLA